MLTLAEVEAEVHRLAAIIDAAGHRALPAFGRDAQEGQPCVEVDEEGYHLVVRERGEVVERMTTTSVDELLYHVFGKFTFALGCDYELHHRDPAKDSRRLMFSRKLELLGRLSPKWASREAEEQAKVLAQHPYDDDVHRRADYTVELRSAGVAPGVAWQKSCEKYPLPNS
jgi:hypothetical protein